MKRFRARSTRQRVVALVHQVRPEVAASTLSGGVRLQQDLGLDSLAMVALATRLHEDLGIDLIALAQRAPTIKTIDDLVAVVEGLSDGVE
jgi:acyl carrier protein